MTGKSTAAYDPAKRRRLVDAAAALFSRVGFERASVDEIASSAGVGKGTVYLYFEDKERLFLDVLWEVRDVLERAICGEDASSAGSLRDYIHGHLKAADRAPDLFRCYMSALFGVNRDFQAAALETFEWQKLQLKARMNRRRRSAAATDREAAALTASINATALVRGLGRALPRDTRIEEELLIAIASGRR
jgi:AcrR family transcriptional regulator